MPYNRTIVAQGGSIQGQTYEVRRGRAETDARADARRSRPTSPRHATRRRTFLRERRRSSPSSPRGDGRCHERLRPADRAPALVPQRRLRVLARGARRGGLRRQRRRRHREVPRGARGLLRALRLGVRPDGSHAAHAHAASSSDISPASRPARSSSPSRSTRCRAGSCMRGRRCTSRASAGSAFEPTVGLGVPTTFSAAGSTPGGPDALDGATPGATPLPTSTSADRSR